MPLGLRGYAGRDSTGPLDLRLGARRVARQDLTVALDRPATATLRGSARTSDGKPLLGARAIVRDAGSASLNAAGTFVVTNLPAATQWASVHAIGRQAAGQAGDLKTGETAMGSVALDRWPANLD